MSATTRTRSRCATPQQVTYCPRLYYLQYVDCVMRQRARQGGLFDHRRVDASDQEQTRTDRGTATSRGIALSSEAWHLRPYLDVIEERTARSHPVETSTGGPARMGTTASRPYGDNERCTCALSNASMEEAFGKPVPRGFQSTSAAASA